MRRAVQTLTLALTSLVLLAVPAFATEETATVTSEGFGSGQWDGLLLAAILGVVLGLVLFIDAYAGSPDNVHTGHEGHDGH